ncbi:transketolase C-terminal domain-containing protein [Desulfosediminicola flagellatus]|uniref:transketolase family protein n=1 Tax=Desulfosediminicola flagellatus TaxID=2569541 RepID=UPI0010ABEF36|nr:transketolase C-terminal domain-containing protein [Desulfosediminicola flagellatus]
MGDLVGEPVEGVLYFVPFAEFTRIREAVVEETQKAKIFAFASRINALYMIAKAGSGHIGSSFSSLDIVSWLHLGEMGKDDLFFSSKGHDAPAYYAVMAGMDRLNFDLIHSLRRKKGLPGHPDVSVSACVTNTGSLGMGISKAKGLLFANERFGRDGSVFVMTGDGELQEGQIWESLVSAANQKLGNLIVVVDHNKLQSDTFVKKTSDLGDLEAKFSSFGWHVGRCDGNDILQLQRVFDDFRGITDQPKVLIADTVKGCGVSFMEHTSLDSDVAMYRFHSGAPDQSAYRMAITELKEHLDTLTSDVGLVPVALENIVAPPLVKGPEKVERLVAAYSEALVGQAERNPDIIALDADLILDTGLIRFKKEFPERFVECGIAEQDMVSQAGGMALGGLLPVVHSFGCFLSARPNEQIYNNATEQTKIVYVGSLAGIVPGGPGHSHQAVRDISSLSAIPGIDVVEPCCEAEVFVLLDYCLNVASGSTYMRLVSIPCEIPYQLPREHKVERGKGIILREGNDAVLIGYGPVLLAQAWKAAEILKAEGINVRIVNLPWLNCVDTEWLTKVAIDGCDVLITLDNHYIRGGQGEMISNTLAGCLNVVPEIKHLGVIGIPVCGTNDEVLEAHGLDKKTIINTVQNSIKK